MGTALQFPCDSVTVPKPTREALLLSVRQWITAAKERAFERNGSVDVYNPDEADEALAYVESCCDRALSALAEAQAAE